MICPRCKEPGEFNKNQPWCKSCQSEAHKAYYHANKARFEETNRRGRKRREDELRKQKERPCTRCGGKFPSYVMHYHHRDPSTKIESVSNLINRQGPRQMIDAEIAKCDLVCANCHAILT